MLYTEEEIELFERQRKIDIIRWYNLEFEPAVEKLIKQQKISAYIGAKLLDPLQHLKRQNIPSKPRQKKAVIETAALAQ